MMGMCDYYQIPRYMLRINKFSAAPEALMAYGTEEPALGRLDTLFNTASMVYP